MPPPQPARSPAAAAPPSADHLIDGRYAVDAARPLSGGGGGLAAYGVTDRRDGRSGLMAVQVRPGAPPRANALAALAGLSSAGVLLPLAHGPALAADRRQAWFVVCPAAPGPALWPNGAAAPRPWGEAELIGRLLRPAAAALAALNEVRVPHRAVRPDNVFLAPGNGALVTLGCAWASPPALLQPALFEPPYAAMCPAPARGDGSVADDVYALAVVMVVLATGRLPLAGLDDDSIIRRKLEYGCFQALAGDAHLSPLIADLVKGMLAPEPLHRPPPTLLADPAAARARHVAARPPRRAPRALDVGGIAAWDARTLAFAIARRPDPGVKLLRLGVADHWLRRVLSDAALAARIEEAMARRTAEAGPDDAVADARLAMRAIAILDPLAPLCWNGLAIWPDGLGPALAADPAPADAAPLRGKVEELMVSEALGDWAGMRPEHCDVVALRTQARQARGVLRQRDWSGGLPRLVYALNPLLACRSPLLAGVQVVRLADLPKALETVAARGEVRAQAPIDREIAAFVASHQDNRLDGDIVALTDPGPPGMAALRQLAVLARLQRQTACGGLPGLAGWIAGHAAPTLEAWRNRAARQARQAALAAAIPVGDLGAVLRILDDPDGLAADERAYNDAQASIRRLDARLAGLQGNGEARAETARRLGQEISAALGLAALAGTAVAAVLR
jgi:hypothetical protein